HLRTDGMRLACETFGAIEIGGEQRGLRALLQDRRIVIDDRQRLVQRRRGLDVLVLLLQLRGLLAQALDHRIAQRLDRELVLHVGGTCRGAHRCDERGRVDRRLRGRLRCRRRRAGREQQHRQRRDDSHGSRRAHQRCGSGAGCAGCCCGCACGCGACWSLSLPKPNQSRQLLPCSASGCGSTVHGAYAGWKPATKAKRRAPGHCASVTLPPETHWKSRPLPPISSGLLGRRENRPDHTRMPPVAPYRPVGWFWSLPTQITARWSPV